MLHTGIEQRGIALALVGNGRFKVIAGRERNGNFAEVIDLSPMKSESTAKLRAYEISGFKSCLLQINE